MAIECFTALICELCNAKVAGPVVRYANLIDRAYTQVREIAEAKGWVTLKRHGPDKHYCPKCADKPKARRVKPVPVE